MYCTPVGCQKVVCILLHCMYVQVLQQVRVGCQKVVCILLLVVLNVCSSVAVGVCRVSESCIHMRMHTTLRV